MLWGGRRAGGGGERGMILMWIWMGLMRTGMEMEKGGGGITFLVERRAMRMLVRGMRGVIGVGRRVSVRIGWVRGRGSGGGIGVGVGVFRRIGCRRGGKGVVSVLRVWTFHIPLAVLQGTRLRRAFGKTVTVKRVAGRVSDISTNHQKQRSIVKYAPPHVPILRLANCLKTTTDTTTSSPPRPPQA